jgi:hypothetical protein
LVALFAGQSDIVQRLAQAKAVSVAIHVRDLVALLSSDATRFLGLAPLAEFGEPGYLNLSVNHGLLFAAAYLVLNVRTVLRLRSTIIAHVGAPGIEVCYAALFFVIAFNVAMLNLPVEGVFPLNGLLAAAIVLSHTGGDFDRKVKE